MEKSKIRCGAPAALASTAVSVVQDDWSEDSHDQQDILVREANVVAPKSDQC